MGRGNELDGTLESQEGGSDFSPPKHLATPHSPMHGFLKCFSHKPMEKPNFKDQQDKFDENPVFLNPGPAVSRFKVTFILSIVPNLR